MLDVKPGHPRYAVKVAKHHLRQMPTATLDQKRQLARLTLKLVYAADPGGLETRRDVKVLRRWFDLLNAADRLARTKTNTWRTASVPPVDAAAIAVDTAEYHARTLALTLRSASDEQVLYHRLLAAREDGRRGEAHREAVEVELGRRSWLIEMPEDTSEYDPAMG